MINQSLTNLYAADCRFRASLYTIAGVRFGPIGCFAWGYLALFLVLFASPAQASSLPLNDGGSSHLSPASATVVWSEDWEGNWFLDWTVEAGTWEVGTPTSGPNEAYAGMNVAATVLDGGYDARVDSRLVSAPLVVPSAQENPRLRFWHWFNFGGGDNGEVQVSTDGGTTWETISPSYLNTGSAVWTRPSLDLSAYAGQTIQLAFDFHSDGSGLPPGWYIDEVAVVTGPIAFTNPEDFEAGLGQWAAEMGTWEVGEATSGPGSCHEGTSCAGTVLGGGYDARVDSRLVSAPLVVPSAQENPRLRFWHWFNFGGGDNGEVQVSTDGGTTWETISPSYLNTGSAVWTRPSLDLSAYAGQTIQLAFDFHSDGSGLPPGWYIDEVTLFCGDERCPAVYDLTFFEEGDSPCVVLNEEFQASAFIRTDPNTVTDDLGTTTLVFSYNDDALDYPDTPTDGVDYTFHNFDDEIDSDYGDATVTKTGPDELALNITLQNADQGTVVAKEFMNVATLMFSVSDRGATSQLAWTPGSIAARGGNNSTQWVPGTFTGCDIQLPVELAGPVEATVDGRDVVLRWSTASETNNAGFDVERRVDDADWGQVAFVEGAGTTTEPQRYSYRVRDLSPGSHTFRLKQIDVDGAFEYSPEVEVVMSIAEAYQLSAVYPNPSTSPAQFTLTVREPQDVRIEVYNVIGQRVATLHDGPLEAATAHRFALDGRTLTSGTYLVRATGETFTATRRATLVR